MSKRNTKLLLEDIIESGNKIFNYVDGFNFDSFMMDDRTKDAVIRNFEIIGEAANRIDDEFKSQNPNIHWSRLRGLRNRIVHEYFGIDFELVWFIINNDLKSLINDILTLYKEI